MPQLVVSDEENLKLPCIENKLRELKSLVSCTPDEYQKFYIKPLEIYEKQLNKLSYLISFEKRSEFFQNTLENIIACLKLRRGYMLPVGADAEACYKEQEIWTYAVFSSALIENSGPLLMEQLLEADALKLLLKFPTIFENYWNCISHHEEKNITNKNNALVQILNEVRKIKKNKFKKEKKLKIDSESESNAKFIEDSTLNLSSENLSNKLIDSLKISFNQKSIEINQSDSFVHHISEGILLGIPKIINWLVALKPDLKKQFYFKDSENFQDAIFNELIKSNIFIKNKQQDTYLHQYYIGRWEERQIIQGVIVPPELLFSPENLPLINSQLTLEPSL